MDGFLTLVGAVAGVVSAIYAVLQYRLARAGEPRGGRTLSGPRRQEEPVVAPAPDADPATSPQRQGPGCLVELMVGLVDVVALFTLVFSGAELLSGRPDGFVENAGLVVLVVVSLVIVLAAGAKLNQWNQRR